jgi:translation initiation factor 3 subunit F
MSTVPGQDIAIRTYISSAVGVHPDRLADSCLFVPVPYEIRYADAEKSGLELISGAKDSENRSAEATTDIYALEKALEEVLGMLDRVSVYVEGVIVSLPFFRYKWGRIVDPRE